MNLSQSPKGRTFAIAGITLQIGVAVAFIAVLICRQRAYSILGSRGVADPQALSSVIGTVLLFTAIGLATGLAGAILLAISLMRFRYRAVWLFWFLVIYSALLLFSFPVGTAVGIFFLVYCFTRRGEFLLHAPHESNRNA